MTILPDTFSIEKCENYLFTIAAENLFEMILTNKLKEYSEQFTFLKNVDIGEVINDGVAEVKICNENLYDGKAEEFLNLSAEQTEVKLADCLKVGIVTSLDIPINTYIAEELDNNEILKKYNKIFDEASKQQIKEDFSSCVYGHLSADEGFSSLLETSETFLNYCITETTKNVVLNSIGFIIRGELRKIGFSSTESRDIFNAYIGQDQNLIKEMENAEADAEIKRLLQNADKEIVKDISESVIRLLISKKSPVSFSRANNAALVSLGKRELISCLEDNELKVCSGKVEKTVMAMGVKIFLPDAVVEEVEQRLKPWFSGNNTEKNQKFQSLNLRALFAEKIETRQGRRLSNEIADAISAGRTIGQVKRMSKVKEFVYDTLVSSSYRINNISYYLIQPEINKGVRGLAGLIFNGKFRRAADWRSVRRTPSGKQVMDIFKGYLRDFIVNDRGPSIEQIKTSLKRLIKKAMFEYEDIIQEHCPNNMRINQCFPILDRVDRTL